MLKRKTSCTHSMDRREKEEKEEKEKKRMEGLREEQTSKICTLYGDGGTIYTRELSPGEPRGREFR